MMEKGDCGLLPEIDGSLRGFGTLDCPKLIMSDSLPGMAPTKLSIES